MSEKSKEVKTIETEYYCDECDIVIFFTGRCKSCYPPYYVYQCPKCKKLYDLEKAYPTIEYVKV